MPIYEYECHDCRRRVSLLVLRPSAAPPPTCPRCGGSALSRLMSRFATVKSDEARMEALSDPSAMGGLDESEAQRTKLGTERPRRMGTSLQTPGKSLRG